MNSSSWTFEQTWSALAEIGKSCREFNELQFKYRQLAISLILAAYAAMGYFWVQADTRAASSTQPNQPANTAVVSIYPANLESDVQISVMKKKETAGSPSDAGRLNPKAPEAQQQEKSPASASDVRRTSLMLLGIGLLSCISTFSIWLIDTRVYHRLLKAYFDVGHEFENRLISWPLPIHIKMHEYISGANVMAWICLFYLIGMIVGGLPWYFYVDLNQQIDTNWWANIENVRLAILGLLDVGLAAYFYIFFSYRRIDMDAKYRLQSQKTTVVGPAAQTGQVDRAGDLLQAAVEAYGNAYVEYSHFAVGASVLAFKGNTVRVFQGCNVENASGSLTICAERNAVAAAVAAGFRDIQQVLVYKEEKSVPPCGACRGVLHEFNPDTKIHLASKQGIEQTLNLREIYTHPFGPESLGRG